MCRHFSATSISCCLINGSLVCSARSSHSSALARYSSALLVTMRHPLCALDDERNGRRVVPAKSGRRTFVVMPWAATRDPSRLGSLSTRRTLLAGTNALVCGCSHGGLACPPTTLLPHLGPVSAGPFLMPRGFSNRRSLSSS